MRRQGAGGGEHDGEDGAEQGGCDASAVDVDFAADGAHGIPFPVWRRSAIDPSGMLRHGPGTQGVE